MSGHSHAPARAKPRRTLPDGQIGAAAHRVDSVRVRQLVDGFVAWLDAFGERSHDPYDFWATRVGRRAKRLYYRQRALGTLAAAPFVALDTFVPASRKLVSRSRRYPMADAHYALAFFELGRETGSAETVERAQRFLNALMGSRCPHFGECCWGLPFDWESRMGTIRAHTPLMTVVPYVYEAFEAGHEATGMPEYLDTMESIAKFTYEAIPVTEVGPEVAAAAYSPIDDTMVINSSAYRAYVLASAGERFDRPEWTHEADRNLAFVLAAQCADGSWPYAHSPDDDFVDNFHTCLVLKNLFKTWRLGRHPDALTAIRNGYAFYRLRLLDPQEQPVPYASRSRPSLHKRDLYDYAEGINLARLLMAVDPEASAVLVALVQGLADQWVLADGHFVTRKFVVGQNRVPYHRWAQSQTFHALVRLVVSEA